MRSEGEIVGKAYPPDELATRLFVLATIAVGLYVAAVCVFVY